MSDIQREGGSATEVLRAYWAAEEARDVERVVAFFTPEGEFVDRLGRVVKGHDALRDFYAASAAAFPRATVEPMRILENAPHVAVQYRARLWDAHGEEREVRVAVFAEIRDDRIARLESYFDATLLAP